MRLRGFSLMTNILDDYAKDMEITALVGTVHPRNVFRDNTLSAQVLECLTTWPLLQRNKVDDSKIAVPVKTCSESENEVVKAMAQKVC
jgi:[histone H3]-lysine36 N-trimethyltransferase